MKRSFRLYSLLIIALCGMLVFTACKDENRSNRQAQQQGGEALIEQDIQPPDAEPYLLLDDYHTRKFEILARLTELMESSRAADDDTFTYNQLLRDATFQVMECSSGLDKTLLGMSMLQPKAENDWQLAYDRYTGYMDMVDGLYKFEFYIAEEEPTPPATETDQPETSPTDEGNIPPQDPLATADEITEPPTMIPGNLAGYIEGTLPEGSGKMAINVYTGRIEDGTRALTLWFEFYMDSDGSYWTQSYYAWDDVGIKFSTVREHVSGDGITYCVLLSENRPESILSTQPDEGTFFDDAALKMEYDGNGATYWESGEVVRRFP